MTDKKYGIAETFTSWQGEGLYTGARMHFVRFAGCSVGKKLTQEERIAFGPAQVLIGGIGHEIPRYVEKCTLYDGREFLCDTNFQTARAMTVEEILHEIPVGVERICLTGGEPLDRDLEPLLLHIAQDTGHKVHIETSGTKSLTEAYKEYSEADNVAEEEGGWLWVTVAPKKGVLPEMIGLANEIKLLVDEHFDVEKIPEDILDHDLVWLQPVNYEWDVNQNNVQRCLELLKEHPKWRISLQLHKILKVR